MNISNESQCCFGETTLLKGHSKHMGISLILFVSTKKTEDNTKISVTGKELWQYLQKKNFKKITLFL